MRNPESKATVRPGSILDGREVNYPPHPAYQVEVARFMEAVPMSPAFGMHMRSAIEAAAEAEDRLRAVRVVSTTAVEPPGIYADEMPAEELKRFRDRDAARALANLLINEGKLEWRPATPNDARLLMRREGNRTSRPHFRDFESEMAQVTHSTELVVISRDDYNRLAASIARLSDIAKGKT